MYEIPADDQSDNKENIGIRSLGGDTNRYTPVADHYPLSSFSPQEKPAAAMYALETRYQPMLDRQTPISIRPEEQSVVHNGFLEPKIISQPIFYSVGNTRTSPVTLEQPIPMNQESIPPTVYSITGRPRRPTMDMNADNLEVPSQVTNKSPTIYSLVDTSRISNSNDGPYKQPLQSPPNSMEEPTNQYSQRSANLYSLIGSPARTSRGVQVNTLDPDQPTPILYTITGDTPIQTNKSNEKSSSPSKKPPTDVAVYTLGNQVNTLKAPPEHEQPIQKPSLYTLVSRPDSPPQEKRTKATATKKAPSTSTTTTRRSSHSLERKPEITNDEMISYPVIKTKQQTLPKESKYPKAETNFIPLYGEERRTHPPPPSQTNPKPYRTEQYPPMQLPDYRSPYTNQTHKAYRERKYNNDPLPVISQNHSDRKTRPALYEPRYRVEKRYPYNTTKPTSLERYPVNTNPPPGLWDNGYQTQTDDDEEYDQRMNRKKQNFKTSRPRAPWIPVW